LRIGWLDLADLFPLSANNVVLLQKLYVLRLCQPALNQALELLFVHLELISYEMNRLRFVAMGALCTDDHPTSCLSSGASPHLNHSAEVWIIVATIGKRGERPQITRTYCFRKTLTEGSLLASGPNIIMLPVSVFPSAERVQVIVLTGVPIAQRRSRLRDRYQSCL
jgi:hypothetical protein